MDGVHVGYMDTDLTSGINLPKANPLNVAHLTLLAVTEGRDEVLADELSHTVKQDRCAGIYLRQADCSHGTLFHTAWVPSASNHVQRFNKTLAFTPPNPKPLDSA